MHELGPCHTLRGCVDWNSLTNCCNTACLSSHPAWVCGLKHSQCNITRTGPMSHPAWVCGLKLPLTTESIFCSMSHPAWVCGLKLHSEYEDVVGICHTLRGCVDWNFAPLLRYTDATVTPCVGVWIETYPFRQIYDRQTVTPCVGVWIETH